MNKSFFLLLFFFACSLSFSQGIYNGGAKIFVAEGATIIGGDMTIATGVNEGKIDLNGVIQLKGDFINNSNGGVFDNIETTPNGTLILSGTYEKSIGGLTPTNFENLKFSNGNTLLQNDMNEIYGTLIIDGVLMLNENSLSIKNTLPEAIEYNSGCIVSETSSSLGKIIWEINNEVGIYEIPFGTGANENNLNIKFEITEAALSANGKIHFATYPTGNDNEPLPLDVTNISEIGSENMADRFWFISSDHSEKPSGILTLNFTDNDISEISGSKLSAAGFNSTDDSWVSDNYETTASGNQIICNNITDNNFSDWWTLYIPEPEIGEIPNGITPNNDGYNDTWQIKNCDNCKVWVYNRWGSLVYQSDNYDNNWDGGNLPSGAYFYVIEQEGKEPINGNLNIMR